MFSSLTRLTFFELKAAARRNRPPRPPARSVALAVELDCADAIAALPVIDGALEGATTVQLVGGAARTRELIEDHLRARGVRLDTCDAELALTLVTEPGACEVTGGAITLGPDPTPAETRQSAHLAWVRAAVSAGLRPREAFPRLRVTRDHARRARTWLRRRVGILTPPLVAWAATERYASALPALSARADVIPLPIDDNDDMPFAALAGCALCVGDRPEWTAAAAALGVPTVWLNHHDERSAARSRPGLELWHWGEPPRAFEVLLRRFEFSHDANPSNLAVIGEHLAALRWPGDRLFRLLP